MPETEWTTLRKVDSSTPAGRRALDRFCRAYWAPVLAYVKHTGDPHPEDTTQAFFAKLIEGELSKSVSRVQGRFRNYLRGAIYNFVNTQRRAARAEKRGGHLEAVPLHAESEAFQYSPDEAFNQSWGELMLHQAKGFMERGIIGEDERIKYLALEPFITRAPHKGEYAAIAEQLDMTPDVIRSRVKRLRANYQHAIRTVVTATLDDPAELDRELAELADALGV